MIEALLHDPFYIALPVLIVAYGVTATATTSLLNAAGSLFEKEPSPNNKNRQIFKDKSLHSQKLRSLFGNYLTVLSFAIVLISVYFLLCIAKYYNSRELIMKLNLNGFTRVAEYIDNLCDIVNLYSALLTLVCLVVTVNMVFVAMSVRHKSKQNVNL